MRESKTEVPKKLLATGFGIFAVLMGICSFLTFYTPFALIAYYILWASFFLFYASVVFRCQQIPISKSVVYRLIICVFLGVLLVWCAPWTKVAELGIYTRTIEGSLLVGFLSLCVMIFCSLGILILLLVVTTRAVPENLRLFVVRLLIVALASVFVCMMFGVPIADAARTADPFHFSVLAATKDMTIQLVFGSAYYFTAVGFIKKVRAL
ncbi:MAG: hypothetical protein LBB42_00380 [Coriobacteriales bacterium]|jgi:hypothetical protein|nr:hypothetical protein [Coriobacteriales bacterium]